MTALERTLDTLFGDMDDLLSEHQKSEGYFTFEGEVIQEPQAFTDRSRHMYDLLYKFTLIYPGIKILDTEFISSGYFSFLFPPVGPFRTVEVHVRPHITDSDTYEISVQWEGYSQLIATIPVSYNFQPYMIDEAFSRNLGKLFITCFNGLCIYHNRKRHLDQFPTYTCKNLEEEQIKFTCCTPASYTITLDNSMAALVQRNWRAISFDWQGYAEERHTNPQPKPFYSEGDKVIVQEKYNRVLATVKKVTKKGQDIKSYVVRTERGGNITVPAKKRKSSKYYIVGLNVAA